MLQALLWARSSRLLVMPLLVALTLTLVACGGKDGEGDGKDTTKAKIEDVDTVKVNRYWNDYARYLAGLAPLPGSLLDSIENRPESIEHRKFFDDAWRKKDSVMLKAFGEFAQTEFPEAHKSTREVFYPLSGPDFMHIYTLFPNAKRYVCFGLEPEGNFTDIRKIAPDQLPGKLARFQRSMLDALGISFYVTRDMGKYLDGTMPAILAYIARHGNEIIDVHHIKLTPDGGVAYLTEADEKGLKEIVQDEAVTGVEVKFRKGKGQPVQVVQYIAADVSDPWIDKEVGFVPFISKLKNTNTFLKAASYVMHWGNFSKIRDMVLNASNLLVQDDSGIAYRFFKPEIWDFKYYGKYHRPIVSPFQSQYQPEYEKAFADNPDKVKPLKFLIGYNAPYGHSHMLVAIKKGASLQ